MRQKATHPLIEPSLVSTVPGVDAGHWELRLKTSDSSLAGLSLGCLGIVGEVVPMKGDVVDANGDPAAFILFLPFTDGQMAGVDVSTVRMFRLEADSARPKLIWDSGVNAELGFVWARIRRPGKFAPIGLPRDRLLQQILRNIARARRMAGEGALQSVWEATRRAISAYIDPPLQAVEELRRFLTHVEVQTGRGVPLLRTHEIRLTQGAHLAAFPLPHEEPLNEFRSRLVDVAKAAMDLPGGMPEEDLFFGPDPLPEVPWHRPGVWRPGDDIDWRAFDKLEIWEHVDLSSILPGLFPQNWWMYQRDTRHTGAASGLGHIRGANVSRMELNAKVMVDGPIITKPVVVDGKVYVGSGRDYPWSEATLYKIDLATGFVEGRFPVSGYTYFQDLRGIGGSPAVVGGRVYFTGVHGTVYCLDTASMTDRPPHPPALWSTSLKFPCEAQNQPIYQPAGDSWSSPLVVNGRVYVGCGEGEQEDTYGFVFCLDADTGRVVWLFCTCKLNADCDNKPNVIPASVAVSIPLPSWAKQAGFQLFDDTQPGVLETGCSVWSSCAYDRALNRIYVGTGNSQSKDGEVSAGTDLPDELYGSGLLSLDADTGRFCGFFQPPRESSYHQTDGDVDVSGSPTIFSFKGERYVAFGCKNGSFFLLEPERLEVRQWRQLLPRAYGSGLSQDLGTAISQVAPTEPPAYENFWGVFATPAVHAGTGKLFIGLGRNELADPQRTPFVRALDWGTLEDAWPTFEGSDKVARYKMTKPPLYLSSEAALSSPAVVNDVVFVSTNRTALYAIDIQDGHCLWAAPGLPEDRYALGPAIYGDYVVMGTGEHVYIYVLGPRWAQTQAERFVTVPPASSTCEPPPWEGPDLRRLEREKWKNRG